MSIFEIYHSEYVSLLMILACSVIILVSQRMLGLLGLYIYNAIAVVAANIQVLQVSDFHLFQESFALGTVPFATTFLVSDIISENYGKREAQKGILVSFIAQGSFMIMMMLSAMHKPSSGSEDIATAIVNLFSPSWRIYLASIIAFTSSQYFDIIVFRGLRYLTKGTMLWFRTFSSTAISGFLDNFAFSYIAWVLLSPNPISMNTLFTTYILSAYFGRLFVNAVTIPVMYISKRM